MTGQGSNSISVNWGANGGVITVVESNACGSGAPVSYKVTILPAPSVSFTGDTLSGCSPLEVDFTDLTVSGSGTITSWNWTFGDGNTSASQNPSNICYNSGAFNVSLTVTNNFGSTAN